MAAKRYAVIDESIVRSLCEVLGRTEGGLTNKEINELLAAARVQDPTPPAPRGTYVMISKRDRLFNALSTRQRRDGCGNAVLAFVAKALALAGLCMFPASTAFKPLDDIDRCVLLLAQGVSRNEDPFSDMNFHVTLWHDDALDLARRGLVRGPVGVTERVHQLNTLLEIEHRAPVTSWPDTADDLDLASLYAQMSNGEPQMIAHDWESYDDEDTDWLSIPSEAGLIVTEKGWRSLDEALLARFMPTPSLASRLTPILDAIQRIAKKQIVPGAWLKVLRTELRTSFKFVRNEFAHNAVEMSRSRGLSLLEHMSELYEYVIRLTA
jgi:hypothetical protein